MDHIRRKIETSVFNLAVIFISQLSLLFSIFPIKTGVNAFLTFSFGLLCILNPLSLICPTKRSLSLTVVFVISHNLCTISFFVKEDSILLCSFIKNMPLLPLMLVICIIPHHIKHFNIFRFTLSLGHQQNESTPSGVLSFCCDFVRSSTHLQNAVAF